MNTRPDEIGIPRLLSGPRDTLDSQGLNLALTVLYVPYSLDTLDSQGQNLALTVLQEHLTYMKTHPPRTLP